jgi:hypothetical protein
VNAGVMCRRQLKTPQATDHGHPHGCAARGPDLSVRLKSAII